MGSRYELTDTTQPRALIDCTGEGARYFCDLMEAADRDFTLVSDCTYFGHASDPALEEPVFYSAETLLRELDALLDLIKDRPGADRVHGLTLSDWRDWFQRCRDHVAAHPAHRYTASYME